MHGHQISNVSIFYFFMMICNFVSDHQMNLSHFSIRQELTAPDGDEVEDRMAQKEFKKIYKAEMADFIAHLRYFFDLFEGFV